MINNRRDFDKVHDIPGALTECCAEARKRIWERNPEYIFKNPKHNLEYKKGCKNKRKILGDSSNIQSTQSSIEIISTQQHQQQQHTQSFIDENIQPYSAPAFTQNVPSNVDPNSFLGLGLYKNNIFTQSAQEQQNNTLSTYVYDDDEATQDFI